MSVSLSDVVQPDIGIQGQTQGAGTPNQAGVGGYLPLVVGENSVLFLDALANVNFSDFSGYSSIINTEVSGITISTSSRLGYRWLNEDRSWMFGINGGYDTRPMATGNTDTGVTVTDRNTVFFQQVAAGIEAVSESWNFNAYGLFPVGTTEYQLNSKLAKPTPRTRRGTSSIGSENQPNSKRQFNSGGYRGGALHTYGLDVGYAITPEWNASIGYYYQHGDDLTADDGNGVLAKLGYEITDGLTLGVNVSYDEAFETRVSGNIEYRFGTGNATQVEKKKWQTPVIQALAESVKHRNVRVHDAKKMQNDPCKKTELNDTAHCNGNKYKCRRCSSFWTTTGDTKYKGHWTGTKLKWGHDGGIWTSGCGS